MTRWVRYSVLVVATSCYMPPSESEILCYQGCAQQKDACMLAATTAAQIQGCDQQSAHCSGGCQ